MSEARQKFYLTTPIYYVNARPHIGHAYTTIVADVVARRHHLLGDDTFLLTGTDEHGQKIERSATAAGIAPQQFTDQVAESFKGLWNRMGITYNDFIRTTDPCHKRGAQHLFTELYNRGHIYLSTYTGAYCVSDEAFVDLPVGTPCPDCGRILEEVTEENFFFRLSAFQQNIIDLIESGRLAIQPEVRRNEVLSFVKGGLKDLSISRSSFKWGIPVPAEVQQKAGATHPHIIYVWLDALTNYMSAIGYGSDKPEDVAKFKKYWPADLHLVGKEIIRFHCVYWPAFLMAADLPLPKAITAHGWLLFEESKMSKSRGNIVRTETILDAFGTLLALPADLPGAVLSDEAWKHQQDLFASDVLRYFLLREIPFGNDGSFSFDALVTRYNADLANGYGNLVSRTLKMISQYFEDKVPTPRALGHGPELAQQAQSLHSIYERAFTDLLFTSQAEQTSGQIIKAGVIDSAMALVASTDGLLTTRAPWKLAKSDSSQAQIELADTLYTAAESIRIITALLYPIMPYATAKVWSQLGLGDIEQAASNGGLKDLKWGGLQPGTKLGPLGPIFPRAPKELIEVMANIENPSATHEHPDTVALPHITNNRDASGRSQTEFPEVPIASLSATPSLNPAAEHMHPISEHHARPVPVPPAPAPGSLAQIAIDDFAKIDLRVAKILVAERIPKADKLLRLEVDLGDEKRQILSGIAEWYTPEQLIGRRIVIIANLAPRKMRGLESHGMLLAASHGENGKPYLATFADTDEIPLGSRLK
jgi:methionyl-tRNA synthetase